MRMQDVECKIKQNEIENENENVIIENEHKMHAMGWDGMENRVSRSDLGLISGPQSFCPVRFK